MAKERVKRTERIEVRSARVADMAFAGGGERSGCAADSAGAETGSAVSDPAGHPCTPTPMDEVGAWKRIRWVCYSSSTSQPLVRSGIVNFLLDRLSGVGQPRRVGGRVRAVGSAITRFGRVGDVANRFFGCVHGFGCLVVGLGARAWGSAWLPETMRVHI